MTPQQANYAIEQLRASARASDACADDVLSGTSRFWPAGDADAVRRHREAATAYRAAVAVLEAHAQPVIALPPLDPDGLDALDRYDARAA